MKAAKNIQVVLFDVDGTLFDRSAAQSMVLERIVGEFPLVFGAFEMARVAEAFAESDRVVTAEFEAGAPFAGLRKMRSQLFLQRLGVREDMADAVTELYVRDYPTVDASMDGALALVRELSRRFLVGVVSNGLPDVQYRKLEAMGLRDIFACIVLSEEIGIRKPDPRIFHHAADLLDVRPQVCLYVGDSFDTDVVGAKAAGMRACWLSREPSVTNSAGVEADLVVNSLGQLRGAL